MRVIPIPKSGKIYLFPGLSNEDIYEEQLQDVFSHGAPSHTSCLLFPWGDLADLWIRSLCQCVLAVNLEVNHCMTWRRNWGWGRIRDPVKGLSLSVPTPLTHTSRTEKSEFSFKGPLSLKQGCPESVMIKQGLCHTSKYITLAPHPPSSQCRRTFLLFMTTQHVSWSYTTCWHREVMWKTRRLRLDISEMPKVKIPAITRLLFMAI